MGLDIVELMVEVEKEFGVQFGNADLERARTVGSLHELLLKELGLLDLGVSSPQGQEVWHELCAILERQFSIPPHEIRPEASFVDDLRLD